MDDYYYVYEDDDNKLYYCSAKTGETTYVKPENKIFLDPKTNEEYVFPPDPDNATNETSDLEHPKESSKSKRISYFVYQDSDDVTYYYNTETHETTYTKPKNAKFLDPTTNRKYNFKEKKAKKVTDSDSELTSPKSKEGDKVKSKNKHAKFSDMNGTQTPPPKVQLRDIKQISLDRRSSGINFSEMVIDVPDEVSTFQYEEPKETANHNSFFPDAENLALPANLQEDIHMFQVDDYAKHFFREHRSHHIFSRKKVTPEDLASFQEEPLTSSLLTSIPKNYQKSAIQMFNIILGYTGLLKEKGKNYSLIQLLSIVDSSPILRDELFFQLIKQTNNNPNEDCLIKTWQIFVIAASIYPSSRDSEVWIKSHLSREAMKQIKTVSDYAQFTYIRFSARCAKGNQLEIAPMFATNLYKDVYESKKVFGASIYEQLWNQKTTHSLFPIPKIIHEMAELLLEKGAENTEGIFRHVGNKKTVTEYQEQINKGAPLDHNIQIHDLASLFKSWFSRLPDPLIPNSYIPKLQNAAEDETFIPFVRKLPRAHLYALKYVIGFFQRLINAEEVTKMNASNLAICFGPDIVSTEEVHDLSAFEKFKNMSIKLLTVLIKDWIVDDIYPLRLDV